jgi:hypothetical protein
LSGQIIDNGFPSEGYTMEIGGPLNPTQFPRGKSYGHFPTEFFANYVEAIRR